MCLSYFLVSSEAYIIFSQRTLFGADTLHTQYIMVIFDAGCKVIPLILGFTKFRSGVFKF